MDIFACSHPAWCDPRMCDVHDTGVEHAETPLTWTAGERRITVTRARYDEALPSGEHLAGPDRIRLHVEDETSQTPAGGPIALDADLTGPEARMLAASLVLVAERIAAGYLR